MMFILFQNLKQLQYSSIHFIQMNTDTLNKSRQNILETQDANSIILLKNPQKFRQAFFEVANISSQSLKLQQYQKALKALNKCIDMLDLGKNILKDISKYWKMCIYANLACANQGSWKMQKCNKFCQKAQEELEKLLTSAQSNQISLNITKTLIRIRFQHCAILSQLNQHEKALQMCKCTLSYLERYIRQILQYTESLSKNQPENKSSETVQFSKQVSSYAQQILKNLIKSLTQPLSFNLDKSSFYYWQRNPQNNEDQVKKKFVTNKLNDQCKRSILGVNKMSHWIDEFNIGTIMHMSELSVKDFENALPIQQYIFKDKLYETVIYCSVANFTIATQMRFIESSKQKQKQKQPALVKTAPVQRQNIDDQESVKPNVSSIIKKYGFKQKSQMFKMSQLYHLRAIHIIAQNIKSTVPYISHLIKSYDKHYIYKKQLQPVVAIEQQSLMSVKDSLKSFKIHEQKPEQNKKQEQQEDQNIYYTGQFIMQKLCKYNSLPEYKVNYNTAPKQLQNEILHQQQKPLMQVLSEHFPQLANKSRNKSQGKLGKSERYKIISKYDKIQESQKRKKRNKEHKDKSGKQRKQQKNMKSPKKKGSNQIQSEVRIKHHSSTQIKLVMYKNKK